MKKTQVFFWIVIAVTAAVLFVWQSFNPYSEKVKSMANTAEEFLIDNLNSQIITSEPLRGPINTKTSSLTIEGIVEWTNTERENEGIPKLAQNATLGASAALKAQDILEKQYFAHEGPNGNDVGDLVGIVGYDYVVIGENLALGNFKDDESLIRAWMDSPGHRENLLHKSYIEIGIGLSRGVFEGNEVWVAVQHFGKPKNACPEVDGALFLSIEKNKTKLLALEDELGTLRVDIENMTSKTASYNKKVRKYNSLIEVYNLLAKETKKSVDIYNSSIKAFNFCAQL